MTRRNSLQCVHEPFGDAFYYGPERLGDRFEGDEETRLKSGFSDSTFKTILDRIANEGSEVCSVPAHGLTLEGIVSPFATQSAP